MTCTTLGLGRMGLYQQRGHFGEAQENGFHQTEKMARVVAVWLACWTPDRAVLVQLLARGATSCSQIRLSQRFYRTRGMLDTADLKLGNSAIDQYPTWGGGGSRNTPCHLMLRKIRISSGLMGQQVRKKTFLWHRKRSRLARNSKYFLVSIMLDREKCYGKARSSASIGQLGLVLDNSGVHLTLTSAVQVYGKAIDAPKVLDLKAVNFAFILCII